MTKTETVCMIEAQPRKSQKPLPAFPNPAPRPEGSLPPLRLEFFSGILDGIALALGKVQQRDPAPYVRAIKSAHDRSIHCIVNCAGGSAASALAIATALLQYPFAVHCWIVGRCSSAAAYIALAADRRTIAPDGYVLLHAARRLCTTEQLANVHRLPAPERQAINDGLNDINDAGTAMLMGRLGVSEQIARNWLAADNKWSATQALERGFVSAIGVEVESA